MSLKPIAADKPIFSKARIDGFNKLLEEKVAAIEQQKRQEKPSRHESIPAFHIETKHIGPLLNKSTRTAERIMQRIREKLNTRPRQYLSIRSFCDATGLNEVLVQQVMDDIVKRARLQKTS